MNPYLQMFRMGNAVMGAVGLLVACFMAAGTDAFASEYLVNMALCAAVVVVFVAGGNSINDSIDYEIDKTSHPERPVPMGRITPKQAHVTGISLLILSVIISIFTFDAACIAIVVIASVLMYLYEVLLKQRGFIGNITIAVLTGMVFLLGSAIVHDVWANLAPALMAGLVTVGREICKDIEDMEGDEGRYTLPMMIGKRAAALVAVLAAAVLVPAADLPAVLPAGEYLITRTCPVVRNIWAGVVVAAAVVLFWRAPGPVTARARVGSTRSSTRRQERRGVHFSISAKNRMTLSYSSTRVKSRSA